MIMVLASFFGLGVCHNAHTSGFYACCHDFSTSEATILLEPSYAAPSTAEADILVVQLTTPEERTVD